MILFPFLGLLTSVRIVVDERAPLLFAVFDVWGVILLAFGNGSAQSALAFGQL